ncbi:MAG TPA: NAD(P)-binding protein, partial [Albitalea sp.]|nr:NAD(P)-binding protein [Albitalea sp.]
MDRWRIAVVGGGWAGMAAAVDAVRRGFEVTLFEMAPHWGGRARRVDIDGLALDNGQHIMIGAYRETLRLMQAVGVDLDAAFVRTPLHLSAPDGQGLVLPAGAAVPSFVRGVLGQRAWPLADRWALLRTAAAWGARGFRCDESETVHGLSQHLPARVREELIEPLCVAALNTPAR